MKRPKISRRAETRPYGWVSAPTGNCRKFLTQLRGGLQTPAPNGRRRVPELSSESSTTARENTDTVFVRPDVRYGRY